MTEGNANPERPLGLYGELLHWSTQQPMWQRDALRRLVVGGEVTTQDIIELVDLVLGSDFASHPTRSPEPLIAAHLPIQAAAERDVRLVGIHSPENLNALPPGADLGFELAGLTVVYGGNGSGKSGYVRVLKRACRARGAAERVLPNILRSDDTRAPSAILDYLVGDAEQTFAWSDQTTPPTALGAVTVFDRACAAVYMNSENEVAYRPLGLDLLDDLAACTQDVRRHLEGLRAGANPQLAGPLASIAGSPVLASVWPPAPALTLEQLNAVVGWTPATDLNLQALERALAAPTVNDTIAGLVARKTELGRGMALCAAAAATIAAAEALPGAIAEVQSAEAAITQTQAAASGPGALNGSGGALWRAMWRAAEAYSTEEAYPGHTFPNTDPDAKCVLCGQPLAESARARFEALRVMVQRELTADAQRADASAERLLATLRTYLEGDTTELRVADLRKTDAAAADRVASFIAYSLERVAGAISASDDRAQPAAPQHVDNPSAWLVDRAGPLEQEIEALQRTSIPGERERMQTELRDLRARRWIDASREGLLVEAARLRRLAAIVAALRTCDTTQITLESSRLTVKYVTDALRADFARELSYLNPSRVKVRIVQRGGHGSTYHRIQLASTTTMNAKVAEVVSDGEFRAVALANFFAEIGSSATRSAIVLDDPVTSLDHQYRARVAERLVKESLTRQVIVFTHDLVFLQDLTTAASGQRALINYRRLANTRTHVGWPEPELPWGGMKIKQRIDSLQLDLNKLRDQHEAGELDDYDRAAQRWYSLLRSTWERAVEEILFVDTVVRYRSQVKTNNLTSGHVWITDEADVQELTAAMTKCSAWTEAHDAPAASDRPLPDPDEVRNDLESLREWVRRVQSKRH